MKQSKIIVGSEKTSTSRTTETDFISAKRRIKFAYEITFNLEELKIVNSFFQAIFIWMYIILSFIDLVITLIHFGS